APGVVNHPVHAVVIPTVVVGNMHMQLAVVAQVVVYRGMGTPAVEAAVSVVAVAASLVIVFPVVIVGVAVATPGAVVTAAAALAGGLPVAFQFSELPADLREVLTQFADLIAAHVVFIAEVVEHPVEVVTDPAGV